jgi:hypothetical protein
MGHVGNLHIVPWWPKRKAGPAPGVGEIRQVSSQPATIMLWTRCQVCVGLEGTPIGQWALSV